MTRHPALSRHQDSPPREVQLLDRVRVRIDAHHAPELQCSPVPTPIEVEAMRIGVDLNRNAIASTCAQDLLDIELVTRPPHQHSPSHVTEDRGVRVRDGAQDALGLCSLIELKAAVHARDDEVETVQNVVRVGVIRPAGCRIQYP